MLFQNTQNQILNHEEIILHGNKIENVDHFKFLGIWIDKNLNWKKNTDEKCKKIAQILAIINQIKPLVNEIAYVSKRWFPRLTVQRSTA